MSYTLFKYKTENIRSSDLKDVKEIARALGISAAPADGHRNIGITIAVPVNLKIPLVPRGHIQYGSLTPKQQYQFIIEKYIPTVITPFVDYGVIIPELHKSGNIHVHLLCYDDDIKDEIDMITLQKKIGQTTMVHKICKGKKNAEIHLNYVHYLDNTEKWLDYLSKSNVKDKLGINFFSKI